MRAMCMRRPSTECPHQAMARWAAGWPAAAWRRLPRAADHAAVHSRSAVAARAHPSTLAVRARGCRSAWKPTGRHGTVSMMRYDGCPWIHCAGFHGHLSNTTGRCGRTTRPSTPARSEHSPQAITVLARSTRSWGPSRSPCAAAHRPDAGQPLPMPCVRAHQGRCPGSPRAWRAPCP